MTQVRPDRAQAFVLLPAGEDPDATTAFFVELGFRVDSVFPADDPRVVEMSGHGLHIRFERSADLAPGVLCIRGETVPTHEGKSLTAPNGTRIEFRPAGPPLHLPPPEPSFVLTRADSGSGWHTGRAGMEYRDLIPDRQGGRFVASHIRIPEGGPVPDYVHFHHIRFQMIYCRRGWVRVVYEGQGPPFVLEAGDCVLQPPRIRHRVLECSPGLEVIEVSCPAEHETRADHDMELPTAGTEPDRNFDGQRFVRHIASRADWAGEGREGFDTRDTGIAAATGGLASCRVLRPKAGDGSSMELLHDGEFLFLFVLRGEVGLARDAEAGERLVPGDSLVIPAKMSSSLGECSRDLELLEVRLPAR